MSEVIKEPEMGVVRSSLALRKEWHQLSRAERYMLDMAEFKGATIQGLQDINKHVENNSKEYSEIRRMVEKQYMVSAIIGGVGGLVVLIVSLLIKLWN